MNAIVSNNKALLLLSIVLLTVLVHTSHVKCALEVNLTDSYIYVKGSDFEVQISKVGGIISYKLGGVVAVAKTSPYVRSSDKKYSKFITDFFAPVENPKVEKFEGGIRIITHSKCDVPDHSLFLECITVYEVYESGAILVNHTIRAWKDTPYDYVAVRMRITTDMYGGATFVGYLGTKKVLEIELPKEYPGKKTLSKTAFGIASVVMPNTKVSLLFVMINPPAPSKVEIWDERKWKRPYFISIIRVSGRTLPRKSLAEGDEGIITYLLFPHMRGEEFNSKAISVLQKQTSVYDYIASIKEIAKSEKAKEALAKAEELVNVVLKAVCMGEVDLASDYVNKAYEYARSAYRTESTLFGIRYIVIPLVAYFVVFAIIAWRLLKRYREMKIKS